MIYSKNNIYINEILINKNISLFYSKKYKHIIIIHKFVM